MGALVLERRSRDTLDWEVEIGAVIGGSGSHLTVTRRGGVVAGYCVANDLTIRARVARPDLPTLGSDWVQSKGMRGSLPLGPWFVPAWQVPDPARLWLRLTVNGAVMQDDIAGDMVFDIGEQIGLPVPAHPAAPGRPAVHRLPGRIRHPPRTIPAPGDVSGPRSPVWASRSSTASTRPSTIPATCAGHHRWSQPDDPADRSAHRPRLAR